MELEIPLSRPSLRFRSVRKCFYERPIAVVDRSACKTRSRYPSHRLQFHPHKCMAQKHSVLVFEFSNPMLLTYYPIPLSKLNFESLPKY